MCMKVVHQNALQLLVSGFGPISARRTFQETSADIFSFRFRGQPRRNLIRFGKCAFKSLNIGSIKWTLLAAIKTIVEDAFAISSVWKLCSRKKSKCNSTIHQKFCFLVLLLHHVQATIPHQSPSPTFLPLVSKTFITCSIYQLFIFFTFSKCKLAAFLTFRGKVLSLVLGYFSRSDHHLLSFIVHILLRRRARSELRKCFFSSAEKTFTNNSCGQSPVTWRRRCHQLARSV